ncbi:hypothetical protein HDE77_003819 [Rhodanobacter sp. MP7CTX1]|nr:hypothetical protein [Rhodanobacter sp. MP7CTX1]
MTNAPMTNAPQMALLPLPLLAGGGWEGVRSCLRGALRLPTPPCDQRESPLRSAQRSEHSNEPSGLITALMTYAQLLAHWFLPLLAPKKGAGRGCAEVRPCSNASPLPNPPLLAAEGAQR